MRTCVAAQVRVQGSDSTRRARQGTTLVKAHRLRRWRHTVLDACLRTRLLMWFGPGHKLSAESQRMRSLQSLSLDTVDTLVWQ